MNRKHRLIRKYNIVPALAAFFGCSITGLLNAQSDINLTGCSLTFDDEFNTLSLTTNSPKGNATWYYLPPYGSAGYYSESQWDASSFSVSNGILSGRAWLDSSNNWHSGNISSMDPTGAGFCQQYGYFEIRCQMPNSGTGAWPAFWLAERNSIPAVASTINPPLTTAEEIDIFEWYGTSHDNVPGLVQEATHNWNSDGSQNNSNPYLYSPQTAMPDGSQPWAGYHIYGCLVDPVHITWYIDGVQTNQISTPTPYMTGPFYIMMDYALGGGWPLSGMVNNSSLNVDWVRAYSLPLPSGWSDSDVGSPGTAGGASYNFSSSTYTVTGGGADIWNNSDQFNFASTSATGNETLIAKITTLSNTDGWAKAGVMFRDSNAAGSVFVDVVATEANGIALQWRNSTNGGCGTTGLGGISAPSSSNPVWVKLVKNGTAYTGYYSADGQSWTSIGSTSVSFSNTQFLGGLAVTAHNNSLANTATFSNVSLSSAPIVSGSTYTIVCVLSGKAVDDPSSSTTQGQQMEQWGVNGYANQRWTATQQANGTWSFLNASSGLALCVSGNSTAQGAAVVQSSWTGAAGQEWNLTPVGDGSYKFVNAGSGMLMDDSNNSTADGALLLQWTDNGGSNQHWKFQ